MLGGSRFRQDKQERIAAAEKMEAKFLIRADLISPLMECARDVFWLYFEPSVIYKMWSENSELSSCTCIYVFCVHCVIRFW